MSDHTRAEQYKHLLHFYFQILTTYKPVKYLISLKITPGETIVATEKSIQMKISTNPNLSTLEQNTEFTAPLATNAKYTDRR